MKSRQGFTLMELLVVLLIIGILSTVALRTIDATRDRGLFDQTTAEMNKLVQAIVGNPDLTYDGRRVDFGYYGDFEQLPADARELVRSNGSTQWHGPYFKVPYGVERDSSYLYDGWGSPYSFNWTDGTIRSFGSGKFPMTVKIVDDISQLNNNTIAGTITDINGAAPGEQSLTPLSVKMYYNNPLAHAGTEFETAKPDPGGYYEFSPTSPTPGGVAGVPIGLHKLVAAWGTTESLIRWVTVVPRSKTIVDFKFTSSFWNKIRVVGAPILFTDSSGFQVAIINDQASDVTLSWLTLFRMAPDTGYFRDFRIGSDHGSYPVPDGQPGTGPGDTVSFTPVVIAPNGTQEVDLYFGPFYKQEVINPPAGVLFNVHGREFLFRFSDGSEITVKP